jgi:ubiquinone/menaquinone biosynthesis C-methylase UbiE
MSTAVRNRMFARIYPRINEWAEAHGGLEHRRELLAGVSGRVVEVGAGHGANFPHYPAAVSEVVAVEPEPTLRELAHDAVARASVPVSVVDGTAERLPVDDATCDVAVASLVLCSVRDPAAAFAEIRRVLRPGGELRFYEHVRAREPGLARSQRVVDVIWPHLGGGCHLTRPTDELIAAAGFDIEHVRHFRFPERGRVPSPSSPHVIGVARKKDRHDAPR